MESDASPYDVLRAEPRRPSTGAQAAGSRLLLVAATAVGSVGLAAGGTGASLLATDVTGETASAGLPLGCLVAGSAVGALVISVRARRTGRTRALVVGYAAGAVGAVGVIAAAVVSSFVGILLGCGAMGAANSAVFLTRYAAADVAGSAARGRALGEVFLAVSVGSVAGPSLLEPSGELARAMGLPPLVGLYLIAVPSFAIAGVLLAQVPRGAVAARSGDTARTADGARWHGGGGAHLETARGLPNATHRASGRAALQVLIGANLAMVAVMVMAPVHLAAHGHDLTFIGLVVSVHVGAMFIPSPLSGWAADRKGSALVASSGVLLIVVAGLTGAFVDPASRLTPTIFLALLGLGWNGAVIGASAMLAGSVPAASRPQVEGWGEIGMGVAAAAAASLAGPTVVAGGFTLLAVAVAAAATLTLAVAGRELGRELSRARP